MTDDHEERAELDRLAHASPGWFGPQVIHGAGWLVIGISYIVLFVLWFGLLSIIGRWFMGWFIHQDLYFWFGRGHDLLGVVLLLAGGAGLIFGSLCVAFLPAHLLSISGAYLVDPAGARDCGVLARKPTVSPTGNLKTHLRFLTRSAQARYEAEAAAACETWEAWHR
jgi:hypothetical protein